MTRTEFDQRMEAGLADAEAGRGVEIEEAFESINARLRETSCGDEDGMSSSWASRARKSWYNSGIKYRS